MPDLAPVLLGGLIGLAVTLLARWVATPPDMAMVVALVGPPAALHGLGQVSWVGAGGAVLLAVALSTRRSAIRLLLGTGGLIALVAAIPDPAPAGLRVAAGLLMAATFLAVGAGRDLVPPRAALAAILVTVGALYLAVPDTEAPTLLIAVTGIMLVGPVVPGAALAPLGLLVAWSAGVGSVGRPAALAGVAAAFTLILLIGALARWLRRPGLPTGAWLLLVHGVAGLTAARWAGLLDDVGQAAVRGAAVAVIAVLAALPAVIRMRRPRRVD